MFFFQKDPAISKNVSEIAKHFFENFQKKTMKNVYFNYFSWIEFLVTFYRPSFLEKKIDFLSFSSSFDEFYVFS